ncbi:unnamed protein product [Lactuca saligna]|uniref:Uncharacterized protein n=1 Tax=Lactuca saligna TaxID=75948 RepID=A0AA35Z5K4_LACSI|nr:unnamed protein product [Lactuca saligna]
MDIEIASVLNRKPIMKPFPHPKKQDQFQFGFIDNELWGIACKMKEKEEVKHYMVFIRDKHLYSTFILNQIVAKTEANKKNKVGDVKCIADMTKWWIVIQTTILQTIMKMFEVKEKEAKEEEKTISTTRHKGGDC